MKKKNLNASCLGAFEMINLNTNLFSENFQISKPLKQLMFYVCFHDNFINNSIVILKRKHCIWQKGKTDTYHMNKYNF